MRWILATLTAALVAAPLAYAHSTPVGAEYEHLVWEDGTFDQTYYQDGWDLHDLWMWEAYDKQMGDGIMLRFHVYGGNTTGVYDTFWIHAEFEVDNETHRISWWSHDDEIWQGDVPIMIIESNRTSGLDGALDDLPLPDDLPVPGVPDVGGGWMHEMQAFLPLADINATVGDTVSGWVWRSTAERDAVTGGRVEANVDVAPGGFWITGSPTELPEERPATPEPGPDPEPPSLGPGEPISIFLQGAGRHLEASGEWVDGQVAIRVANPYNSTAQVAQIDAPSGATALAGSTQQVAAAGEALFLYDVPLTAAARHLIWDITTDIGGHARLEVQLPAAPAPTPAPPVPEPKPLERTDPTASPPVPEEPPVADPVPVIKKDSPLGLWIVVAAFALVVARRR